MAITHEALLRAGFSLVGEDYYESGAGLDMRLFRHPSSYASAYDLAVQGSCLYIRRVGWTPLREVHIVELKSEEQLKAIIEVTDWPAVAREVFDAK